MKKLLIVTSYLVFFVLGGLTFTYLTTTEAASSLKKISVFQEAINYYVDKVEKVPAEGQSGFIYKGTTYVPIRFISESLGEKVTWDGKTKSIYIGDAPKFIPLKDVKPISSEDDFGIFSNPAEIVISTGERFEQSYQFGGRHGAGAIQDGTGEYSSNGKYIGFETYLAPVKKSGEKYGAGSLKIYADDELVYDSGSTKEKTKVNVNFEGASKVRLEIVGGGLGVLDPHFIQ
ncbi:hypothetical protein D1B33_14570 [Lysinibacillus yapensis]|uniref:Copper amine oxidase-like N-terminal domain-containing protein n=1 Tax=Ureibacillus yapensis TaxID=2304605 RepID=A0A396S4Y0_9BACL|nr:stalk domain-containing protein [Lysinibacillus yapensis]RHW34021.1 hypothetical protein D1B33_14570 [Lysinibacillus yapensis]